MFGITKSAWLVLIAVVLVTFANVTLKRVPLAAVVILGEHLPPANNPQQSWGFEGEPPEAVMKDSGTRDWTLWGRELHLQLIQLLVRHLLVLDIGADHLLVPPAR